MKKEYTSTGHVKLSTDKQHILHRVGDTDYPISRHTTVKAADVDRWEEVALSDVPAITEAQYNAKVAELIHERYSPDDETSLINNMLDESPTPEHVEEYRAYQAYRAECKLRAKDPGLYTVEPTLLDGHIEGTEDGTD